MPVTIKIADKSLSEIENEYKVKAQMGKITVSKGKYLFTVGKNRWEINPAEAYGELPLEKIVTRETMAGGIIVEGKPVLIMVYGVKLRKWILCYIPVPDFRQRLDSIIRQQLVNTLIADKRIPADLGKQILGEMKM